MRPMMAMRLLIEMASGLIILGPPAVAFLAAEQIIARPSLRSANMHGGILRSLSKWSMPE